MTESRESKGSTNGDRHRQTPAEPVPICRKGLAVLVGAGPGEPSLITLAGADWLRRADCIIYDRLASPALLDLCRPEAEKIYVGKGRGAHEMTQEQINRLLVEETAAGWLVVRLKGGDPFIFGRGGEEADALREADLDFRVVPGVTAGMAAGAYAGIPLTDRRCGPTLAFVTGHEDPAKATSQIDWAALAKIDTLVFYMGVVNLPEIARKLIAAGRGESTPAAVIERATSPQQRTVVGTLGTIAADVAKAGVQPPAITIVGDVVGLRERLDWRSRLPLAGKTILVTRTRQQPSQLSARLAELGAEVIEAPTIEIQPVADFAAMDAALTRLSEFAWLVFTSPNGVDAMLSRMKALGLDGRALANVKIAAVGPGTAEALAKHFLKADLVPEKFTTADLAKALISSGEGVPPLRPAGVSPAAGRKVLLARADIATPELPDALRAAGIKYEELVVYRTVRPAALPSVATEALAAGRVDGITFTSSSTVENFLAMAGNAKESRWANAKLAAIGPVTAETLRKHGLEPAVVASEHTIEGLVEAILQHVGR